MSLISTQSPAVDFKHVARLLRVLGVSGFVNRFDLFLDETLVCLEAIEGAFPRGDRETMMAAAVVLRGAAQTVGATQLTCLASELLAADDLSQGLDLLARLHDAAHDAQRELMKVLS